MNFWRIVTFRHAFLSTFGTNLDAAATKRKKIVGGPANKNSRNA